VIVVAAWWLAVVHLIGLAILPVLFRFFHTSADRGFGLALPAGLLTFGLASWWLGVTGAATNSSATSLWVLACLAAACWGFAGETRRDMLMFWRRRRGLIILEEAILVFSFLAFLWVRGFASDINGTEKFMDFAFLNAVTRSDTFPPIDPWMAPSPTMPDPRVNYYYFGYLCLGLLIQLTGVAPAEGFNLSLALVFSMVAVGTFSLGYTLARDQVAMWTNGRPANSQGTPIPAGNWSGVHATPYVLAGGTTAALTLVAGNLWTVLRRFDGSGLWERDFWSGIGWNATRVLVVKDGDRDIDYTINEFPAFSFLLGDLHPHVLSLPFAVLAVAIAYRWFLDPPLPLRMAAGLAGARLAEPMPHVADVPWRRLAARIAPWASVTPVAAMIGTLYFSNSWDFPTMFALVLAGGVLGVFRWRNENSLPALITAVRFALVAASVGAVAVLAVGPFATEFRPPVVAGPGELPIGLVSRRSELSQFLEFWGLQLLWIAPALAALMFIISGGDARRRATLAIGGAGVAVVVVAVAELRDLGTYALAVVIGVLALVAVMHLLRPGPERTIRVGGEASAFPFVCLAFAVGLLALCEVVYIRDFYGGSLRRMNTVFKMYYQAWFLLAVAAPQVALWTWRLVSGHVSAWGERGRDSRSLVGRFGAHHGLIAWWAVIAVGMAFYPVHVVGLRTNRFSGGSVIDGMDWMRRYHPDDLAAARWLTENAQGDTDVRAPVVLEATGGAYSEYSRIATQTGFPTVLGWDQHERLWRGESANAEVERRKRDVERFYRNGSGPEAREVLERYGVSFVVKGYLEAQAYPGPGLDELDDPGSGLMEVFRQGNTVVYATGIVPRNRAATPVSVPPVRFVR
jgi:YYY domain-containing protein